MNTKENTASLYSGEKMSEVIRSVMSSNAGDRGVLSQFSNADYIEHNQKQRKKVNDYLLSEWMQRPTDDDTRPDVFYSSLV